MRPHCTPDLWSPPQISDCLCAKLLDSLWTPIPDLMHPNSRIPCTTNPGSPMQPVHCCSLYPKCRIPCTPIPESLPDLNSGIPLYPMPGSPLHPNSRTPLSSQFPGPLDTPIPGSLLCPNYRVPCTPIPGSPRTPHPDPLRTPIPGRPLHPVPRTPPMHPQPRGPVPVQSPGPSPAHPGPRSPLPSPHRAPGAARTLLPGGGGHRCAQTPATVLGI